MLLRPRRGFWFFRMFSSCCQLIGVRLPGSTDHRLRSLRRASRDIFPRSFSGASSLGRAPSRRRSASSATDQRALRASPRSSLVASDSSPAASPSSGIAVVHGSTGSWRGGGPHSRPLPRPTQARPPRTSDRELLSFPGREAGGGKARLDRCQQAHLRTTAIHGIFRNLEEMAGVEHQEGIVRRPAPAVDRSRAGVRAGHAGNPG